MATLYERARSVALPAQSRIAALYEGAFLADAFAIALPPGTSHDTLALARFALERQAPWVDRLMGMRDAIVGLFGLKTAAALRSDTSPRTPRVGIFRIYETLDLYRDMSSNLLDAYLSQKSNELNVAMRKLSAVSLTFLPLTFLTVLFGMNFARMPWAETNPLFWMGLMAFLAVAAYGYFRYKRWI